MKREAVEILEEIVKLHERNVEEQGLLRELGRVDMVEALEGRVALADAQVRLATLRGGQQAVAGILQELLTDLEEHLSLCEKMGDAGRLSQGDLGAGRIALLETRLRILCLGGNS